MTLIINYYFESCVKSHTHVLMGHAIIDDEVLTN
jgi:hypothetical protein